MSILLHFLSLKLPFYFFLNILVTDMIFWGTTNYIKHTELSLEQHYLLDHIIF